MDAWSIGDVSEWLKSLEFEELVDVFVSVKVNGYELLWLIEVDLK